MADASVADALVADALPAPTLVPAVILRAPRHGAGADYKAD
jgi:hypothetical protein